MEICTLWPSASSSSPNCSLKINPINHFVASIFISAAKQSFSSTSKTVCITNLISQRSFCPISLVIRGPAVIPTALAPSPVSIGSSSRFLTDYLSSSSRYICLLLVLTISKFLHLFCSRWFSAVLSPSRLLPALQSEDCLLFDLPDGSLSHHCVIFALQSATSI